MSVGLFSCAGAGDRFERTGHDGVGASLSAQTPAPTCTNYQPGCGADPIPAAGCYATCTTNADCASGEECATRSIDPCAGAGSGPAICAACGADVNVCVPAAQPPTCKQFVPGCGSDPLPAAGCYQECTTDSDCATGRTCESRSINPCADTGNGQLACTACGMAVGVCL